MKSGLTPLLPGKRDDNTRRDEITRVTFQDLAAANARAAYQRRVEAADAANKQSRDRAELGYLAYSAMPAESVVIEARPPVASKKDSSSEMTAEEKRRIEKNAASIKLQDEKFDQRREQAALRLGISAMVDYHPPVLPTTTAAPSNPSRPGLKNNRT